MKRTSLRRFSAVILITLLFLCLSAVDTESLALGSLRVVFLDVGQGDSELLRDVAPGDPDGFNVLIDGGETYAGPGVVSYLRQNGVGDLDVLVASHPDSDHIGGLIAVLQATDLPVRAVVVNGYPGTSQTWQDFVNAVTARGLTPTVARYPAEYTWGEMDVHVLSPLDGLVNPDTNDASLVLRVDHGEVSFLFTGDISSAVEAGILARGTPVAAEVLKVAHHGSAYSSSSSFLAAVGPADSVIEVGPNRYGHPSADTLQRLADAGSTVWRTDRNGSVIVLSDGFTYSISAERSRFLFLPLIFRELASTPGSGNIVIQAIFYDGVETAEADEYVEIQNVDSRAINLQGWTLRDAANHIYTFPAYSMQPNQTCRVYTNQSHPESCGFNYGSGAPIWNNSGDCAYLRNALGQDVSSRCY